MHGRVNNKIQFLSLFPLNKELSKSADSIILLRDTTDFESIVLDVGSLWPCWLPHSPLCEPPSQMDKTRCREKKKNDPEFSHEVQVFEHSLEPGLQTQIPELCDWHRLVKRIATPISKR